VLDGMDGLGFGGCRGGGHPFWCAHGIFLACSAHRQVMSRIGEVLQVPDGWMGQNFELRVMRRR
jgi:hypothetical protein